MTTADATPSSSAGGSILTRKTGPLANWIWMALLLLVALVYSMWQRGRSEDVAVDQEQTDLPGDQTAPPIFILPQNPQPSVTVNVPGATPTPAPPTGSRPVPPRTAPPVAAQAPRKPVATYATIPVTKYDKANAAWNSTLWGIAQHYGYGSDKNNWTSIWSDPKNAALKAKRGVPEKIRPGDVVYVRQR